MAQKIQLIVEYDGKISKVVVRPKTYKEFEKKFESTVSEFQENPSATGTYWLAWHSFLIQELTTDGFEQWIDGLDGVEFDVVGEEHPKEVAPVTSDIS